MIMSTRKKTRRSRRRDKAKARLRRTEAAVRLAGYTDRNGVMTPLGREYDRQLAYVEKLDAGAAKRRGDAQLPTEIPDVHPMLRHPLVVQRKRLVDIERRFQHPEIHGLDDGGTLYAFEQDLYTLRHENKIGYQFLLLCQEEIERLRWLYVFGPRERLVHWSEPRRHRTLARKQRRIDMRRYTYSVGRAMGRKARYYWTGRPYRAPKHYRCSCWLCQNRHLFDVRTGERRP